MSKLIYILVFLIFISNVSALDCRGNIHLVDSGNKNPNNFSLGESIYINGDNFPENFQLDYSVVSLKNDYVFSSVVSTDNDGKINNFKVYDVPLDSKFLGEYKIELIYDNCKKSKNFKVSGSIIPEFAATGAIIASALSLLGVLRLRRNY